PRMSVRGFWPLLAFGLALTVVVGAEPGPSPARAAIQLELADLLFDDERYFEAIPAYGRAKEGANPQQLVRATSGLLRSLLLAAEFDRAYDESLLLRSLAPGDPDLSTLAADGFWGNGLFEEADALYEEVLAA
ncbi:MAG: hypothetical protein GWN87_01430, partial [Desulfuromonadales bacterium]|nr:hypothetical protein [Desulfuromonadales bacterium]